MDDLHYQRYQRWRTETVRLHRMVTEPPPVSRLPSEIDVAAIRKRLGRIIGGSGISQAAFARRYGFSEETVRAWERRRRKPDHASRVLLLLIDRDPHAVDAAIDAAIEQAEAERARAVVEVEPPPRPSSVPFEVVRLERTLKRKQRGTVPA